MGDIALSQCERIEALAIGNCTYGGGANVKGSWVQITAATSFAYDSVTLILLQPVTDGGGDSFLVDIGIGAAASEIVVVPNIHFDGSRGSFADWTATITLLPITVASGSRLACRCQAFGAAGSRTIDVFVVGRSGGSNLNRAITGPVVAYGVLTASTNATLVDQGAVANTYGAWTQIVLSTSSAHNFLQVLVTNNDQNIGTAINNVFDFQVGLGGVGVETIIGQFRFGVSNGVGIVSIPAPLFAQIPSGTRIIARCKCDSVTASARNATFMILAG